jgi:dienelactone hydrolase
MKRSLTYITLCILPVLILFAAAFTSSVSLAAQATPAATEAAPAIEPKEVSFEGDEDLEIFGLLYAPETTTAPTILLIHEAGSKKEIWDEFAQKWVGLGYTLIAIDARGHGKTGGYGGWAGAIKDWPLIFEQMKKLPEVNPDEIAVIGASMGGGAAYFACAAEVSCKTAVLLSPAPLGLGPKLIERFAKRSVLVIVAEDDGGFAVNAPKFAEGLQGASEIVTVKGSDHGTQILRAMPEMIEKVETWLAKELPTTAADATAEATAAK